MRLSHQAFCLGLARIAVLLSLVFANVLTSARAEARRAQKKQPVPEVELATPERMLGYGELMRLKPQVRARYLRRISDMMVEISQLPVYRRYPLIVDEDRISPAERFYRYTWAMLVLPPAVAEGLPRPLSTKCGTSPTPVKVNGIEVAAKQCSVGSNQVPECTTGYLPLSDRSSNGSLKCVSESDYRMAMGTRAAIDWSAAKEKCDSKRKADAASGVKPKKTEGDEKSRTDHPCIYAGWIQTTQKGSCPHPESHVDLTSIDGKKFSIKCEDPKLLLCNPANFGVVKQSGTDFIGVCVQPSVDATENCRSLSVAKGTTDLENQKLDISNPNEPPPQDGPNDDKFKNRRASLQVTEALFKTPGFGDFYAQQADKQSDFCSSTGSNKDNITNFCDECQAMAQKMGRSHKEIKMAGDGRSGSNSQ